MDIRAYNRLMWDKQVENGNPWTVPVSPEVIAAARQGTWSVLLTEIKPVPRSWFPEDFTALFVFNLLPVPPLDGGHVLFGCIEAVRGEALPKRTEEWVQQGAFILLIAFILFVSYNDILRIVR